MIREPLARLSEAFSAICCQQTTSKNDVASSHSWVWRFIHRRLTASPKLAVAWPLGVKRSSGSRVMLPTTVTVFPFDIALSPFPSSRLGHRRPDRLRAGAPVHGIGEPDDLVADHLVCEEEDPVELCDRVGVRHRLDDDVVPLPPVPKLVGEAAPPPPVDPPGAPAPASDQLRYTVDDRPVGLILQ